MVPQKSKVLQFNSERFYSNKRGAQRKHTRGSTSASLNLGWHHQDGGTFRRHLPDVGVQILDAVDAIGEDDLVRRKF